MKSKVNRRDFMVRCFQAGMTSCLLLCGGRVLALKNWSGMQDDEIRDPQKLNYCGYQCPENCQFLLATIENDMDKKKEAYDTWEIKERYGLEFDPETAFCHGCKTRDKPEGVVLTNCTVRSCAMEKGLDCCIECDELKDCPRELWKVFPDFYQKVLGMQAAYRSAKSN